MTLYILRRFSQAVLSMLIALFIFYLFFVYIAANPITGTIYRQYQGLQAELAQLTSQSGSSTGSASPASPASSPEMSVEELRSNVTYMQEVYKVDQPWPLNFLLWLFDPRATMKMSSENNVGSARNTGILVPKGININLFGWQLRGSGILTGDIDTSTVRPDGASLGSLLADRGPNSLLLMGAALFFALLIAVPIGIISAINQHSRLDTAITFLTFAGLSIPPFMLAFILSALFAILPYSLRQQGGWDWLPMLQPGYVFSVDQEGNWINRIYHMILPVATLTLVQTVLLVRHVRSSILEVLGQDYIRTALAKGLSTRRVIMKHALRNALIPIITIVSLSLPTIISGSIIVEQVYSYPGMGQLFFKAMGGCVGSVNTSIDVHCTPFTYVPNPAIALGLLLVMTVLVALSSMLADILYVASDPRIDLSNKGK